MRVGRRKLQEKDYRQDVQGQQDCSESEMQSQATDPGGLSSLLGFSIKHQDPGHLSPSTSGISDALARLWLSTDMSAPVDAKHCNSQEEMCRYRLLLSMRALQSGFDDFDQVVRDYVERDMLYRLPADHLITLIHYNVIRAFAINIQQLGLSFDAMCLDQYQSKFPTMSPKDPSLALLPPGLRPTQLQQDVPHHPMWDLFPDPVLRDNVLRYGEDNFDDMQLCEQIFGDYSSVSDEDTSGGTGLIAWSDPASISGWEVTKHFSMNWSWFLKGAFELEASTNMWRAKRGESSIEFA